MVTGSGSIEPTSWVRSILIRSRRRYGLQRGEAPALIVLVAVGDFLELRHQLAQNLDVLFRLVLLGQVLLVVPDGVGERCGDIALGVRHGVLTGYRMSLSKPV